MGTDHLPLADDLGGPSGQATRVRYGVLALLCALSFVLYLDRICISKAEEDIKGDLGLTHFEMGFVFAAFTVAYGLFEVVTGRWGDRYGSRNVLMRIVLWWSAFTALTGCVWRFTLDSGLWLPLPWGGLPLLVNSFMLMLLVRFLFGAGEAGALPNAARIIARWFPPHGRGSAQGLINTSQMIGAAVAPVLAAYLIKLVGWRLTFVIFGSLGVVWVAAFAAWFRDDPTLHPGVNEAERRHIRGGGPVAAVMPHPPVPWRRVLSSASVWLLGGVIGCTSFFSYLLYFWYPTYLQTGRGVKNIEAGWLAGLVLAGGALGCVLGGYLHDRLVRLTGERRWTRRLLGFSGLVVAALLLLASSHCDSAEAAALVTAAASLSTFLTLAAWWATVTDISGKHVGAVFGLINSMGVPGAVASQLFFGWFADWRKEQGFTGREQLDPAFPIYAGVLLLGAVGWLLINPTRSVVDEPAPEENSLTPLPS